MRNITVHASTNTREGKTCKPAMGFSFAAGTTDGPGAFDFKQSDTRGTIFWKIVRDFIKTPTAEQESCHAPKPILLDVGEMHYPYEWVPYIVEISIVRIGNFVILAVPGELTTMSGRRLVRAVKEKVEQVWGNHSTGLNIVIAGLSNTYSSYITTFEEYQAQRYEGGFTLFGPHTLDAYIQEFKRLADCMVNRQFNEDLSCDDPGPEPPNLLEDQWSMVPGVVVDSVPFGAHFGDVTRDIPRKIYRRGETVEVEFRAANPRNDFKAEATYMQIERKLVSHGGIFHRMAERVIRALFGSVLKVGMRIEDGSNWIIVHRDTDWSTKFRWYRDSPLSPYSYASIQWEIPQDATPGLYRIRYLGNSKNFMGSIESFEGLSSNFEVRS